MRVISNATCLIALGGSNYLPLLRSLYGRILIPQAVHDEVVVQGARKPGAAAVAQAISQGWIVLRRVRSRRQVRNLMARRGIDQGEAESLVLALEEGADLAIIDEGQAYLAGKAISGHFRVTAIPFILDEAEQATLIRTPGTVLRQVVRCGYNLAWNVLNAWLRCRGKGPRP